MLSKRAIQILDFFTYFDIFCHTDSLLTVFSKIISHFLQIKIENWIDRLESWSFLLITLSELEVLCKILNYRVGQHQTNFKFTIFDNTARMYTFYNYRHYC